MNKTLPYVYRLDNTSTGEFYIGGRFRNKVPSSEDLGTFYFTSSKKVKADFNNFTPTILAEFFDEISAYEYEQNLIKEHWGDQLLLNKNYRIGTKVNFFPDIKTPEQKEKLSSSMSKYYKQNPEVKLKQSTSRKGRPSPNKGVHRPHTQEEKQKISASQLGKTGVNASGFSGMYTTPWGTYDSSYNAATAISLLSTKPILPETIQLLCGKKNKIPLKISKPYLKNFVKGQTPFEMGWSFTPTKKPIYL